MVIEQAGSLRWQQEWHHDDSVLRGATDLPDLVADLQDLACTAFILDRSIRRGAPDRGEGVMGKWSRSLRLTVPLRRPDFWRSDDVRTAVEDLLGWLTDDEWELVPLPRTWDAPAAAPLFDLDPPDEVALFSGGLDAVTGAALHLMDGATLAGVSIESNAKMGGYQRRTARELQRVSAGRFRRLTVPIHRIDPPSCEESSRRTRGLLFLSVGLAAAVAAGRERLLVFENGVGAINLPYVQGQRRSMTSRAVHPQTLQLAEHLAGLVLDHSFAFVNPYLAYTKGQMVANLDPAYAIAAGLSESCDGAAALRGHGRCGACTSCLLRKASFAAARRESWDSSPYVFAADHVSDALRQTLWQAHRLDVALREPEPLLGLRRAFPEVDSVLRTRTLEASSLVSLYKRHVQQWQAYPHALVPRFLPDLEQPVLSA